MTQILSIKDTRSNLADIVSRVEMTGQEIVITKFGKPRAMLVPISDRKLLVGKFDEAFGVWKSRKDVKDTGKWVRDLRKKISLRQRDE
jgi:prevent-host-death family protein